MRETSAMTAVPEHPRHHPSGALLLDYASGAMGEAEALAVATHLVYCPACRGEVARIEAMGGALLDTLPGAEIDAGAFAAVLARLDAAPVAEVSATAAASIGVPQIPLPLRDYVGPRFEAVAWRRLLPGVSEAVFPVGAGDRRVSLLRVRAGVGVPQHTHEGTEFTLVLQGAFDDGQGLYGIGDLQVTDGTIDHRPTALSGDDCICLAVVERTLRLTGPIGRWLNRFVSF
jgi:putative transcriptional regulator